MNQTTEEGSRAAAAALILSGLDRGGTIGVMNIGIFISAMIYGVTFLQAFHYYRSAKAKDDFWWINALVPLLLFLDSIHQGLVMHISYYYLVTNYGNPFALLEALWSIPAAIIVTGMIALVVDSFFAIKVWRLKRSGILTGVCVVATVAHLGTNLAYSLRFFKFKYISDAETQLKGAATVALVVGAATNVTISSVMVWVLSSGKGVAKRSADAIDKLISFTIATGMVTTLFEIATLVAYLTAPHLLYNLALQIIFTKLYTIAVLTALNSRAYIRKAWQGGVEVSPVSLSTLRLEGREAVTNQATRSTSNLTQDNGGSSITKSKGMV